MGVRSRLISCSLSCGLAAALPWAAPVHAATVVTFANSDRYTDARPPGALGGLGRYLERLGASLDPSLTLRITVLDVDLAGRESFTRGPFAPRLMTGITWPAIKLRYTLTRGRAVLASGEETITDQNYQMNVAARASADSLAYEKAMLRDWFDARFARHRAERPRR